MFTPSRAFAILSLLAVTASAQSGTGVTTRYWDCCKTSCAWNGKAAVSLPVKTCDKGNNPLSDVNARSGCDGGAAFACGNNSPWAVNDQLAYGFAAVNLAGSNEGQWCCSCYKLTFTSGPVAGKTMIVQATNTGGDVGGSQFDLMIPGGGVGAFPSGCTNQYGSLNGWGQQYGGVSSRSQCDNLPPALRQGCYFRFDWFMGADNPNIRWEKVTCPAAIANVSGCVRNGEGTSSDPGSVGKPSSTSTSRTSSRFTTSTVKASSTSRSSNTRLSTSSRSSSSSKRTSSTTSTAAKNDATGAPRWGQCGGLGWKGPTTCQSPWTCVYSNPWYSQCL